MAQQNIILATLNAKYIHASLGLRYLYANLGDLQSQAKMMEFTIKRPAGEIADEMLATNPAIIAFGIYIWNTERTLDVVRRLKKLNPGVTIIIGGPEVSYEFREQPLYRLADHLITGQADLEFKTLCQALLDGQPDIPKLIRPAPFSVNELALPYQYYNEQDIAHRIIYVEASRGCPFKCEFCLSSLDKTSYPFNLDQFLAKLDRLYQRGARNFKFVDRTFNLKIASCVRILGFFLERLDDELFLHFELIPDNLPDPLRKLITRFPPGALQFEIGIQTFTTKVQALISRRQDNERTINNLVWLKENTKAHLHTDLIFGLPGETLESFADSFNQLIALEPDEVQVGILKRLRGTPIVRHTNEYGMEFAKQAPYEIRSTRDIDRQTMQRMVRFARYWDLIANSSRFRHSLPVILGIDPFDRFLELSDYLYQTFARTYAIHLDTLFISIGQYDPQNPMLQHALERDKKIQNHRSVKGQMHTQNQRQRRHHQLQTA